MKGLILVAPALATEPRNLVKGADLGQVMRLAASRALLATDGPGLNYVRDMINRRKEEVMQVCVGGGGGEGAGGMWGIRKRSERGNEGENNGAEKG